MFGDLDWPVNASRGLSAIADFLFTQVFLPWRCETCSYPTTVLNERMRHFRGIEHILWPHIYRVQEPQPRDLRPCSIHDLKCPVWQIRAEPWWTTLRRPHWRSARSIRRSWSTVSNAAVRSSKHRAVTSPLSAARRRSLYTFVAAVCGYKASGTGKWQLISRRLTRQV